MKTMKRPVQKLFIRLTSFVLALLGLAWFSPTGLAQNKVEASNTGFVQSRAGSHLLSSPFATSAVPEAIPIDIDFIRRHLILDNGRANEQMGADVQGPRTGGGGNSCALVISQATYKLLTYPEPLVDESRKSQLDAAIRKAKFYISERPLLLNGEVKDAINYPATGEVFISRRFCDRELIEVSGRTLALLLHEYLGLARMDDRRFQISGQFLERYTTVQSDIAAMQRVVDTEVQKDLRNRSSCFGGKLNEFHHMMERDYGGRYFGSYAVNIAPAGWIFFRAPAKYCGRIFDANMRPTVVQSQERYRECITDNEETYVATITFSASTSGTAEDIARVYEVKKLTKHTLIVDIKASYFPEDSEIRSSQSHTIYECRLMQSVGAQ